MKNSDQYLFLALLALILCNTSHNSILAAFWGLVSIFLSIASLVIRRVEK